MFNPRVTAVMMLPTASGECLMMRPANWRRHELIVRHDKVDEPDLQRPRRRKGLARQQQFQRALPSRQPRQSLGSSKGRRHAKIDFRFGEKRLVAGDGEMDGLGDLASAAEC
jgi:hypothetical protein